MASKATQVAAMAAVAVATFNGGRAAAAPSEPTPVVLHVTDYAHLVAGELLEAQRLAAQVYEHIGVRIIWSDGCAAEAAADGALHLDVIILDKKMTAQRQPAPMAFGQATCVGCGLVQPALAASSDESAIARVRSSDPGLAALIDRAVAHSATFQRLVTTIERSNGIVYIEVGTCTHGVRACLKMWMETAGPNRFLRIAIDGRKIGSDAEKMGLIGHELQHAVEALSESGVMDGVSLYNFFRRLAPTDNGRFETTAALHAGDDVQDELRDSNYFAEKK